MANIYTLNSPPNPLFDVLNEIGRGFFPFGRPPPNASQDDINGAEHQQQGAAGPSSAPQQQQTAQGGEQGGNEQSSKNGPMPNDGPDNEHYDIPFRGCRGRGGYRGRRGHHGWGGRHGHGPHPGYGWGPCGGHHHRGHHQGRGGHPLFGFPPFAFEPRTEGHHGPSAPQFEFLQNLGNQFGINMSEIFENINGNQRSANNDVDFVPRADIFDTQDQYLVHVSLPGAQKQDVSIDYDPENSTLRLAGVVYRPGVDEVLSNALVVEGRAKEVGVFEKEIHLGTRSQPANVDVDKITAKLADGVLAVVLPKLAERPTKTRRVSVEQVTKGKEKERVETEEAESHTMEFDTETEAGDETMGEETRHGTRSPSVRDEEDEEREYITVDVQ